MSRQDANAAFAQTSFLYGGNASYIENLYVRYEADPQAVDAQWREFFQSLKDEGRDHGPSWKRPNWPTPEGGELVAALTGERAEAAQAGGGKGKGGAWGRRARAW